MELMTQVIGRYIEFPPIMMAQKERYIFVLGECEGLLYAYSEEDVISASNNTEKTLDDEIIVQLTSNSFIYDAKRNDKKDKTTELPTILEYLGEEGDPYIIYYDNFYNRFVYRNIRVIPLLDKPSDDNAHNLQEFRRIAAKLDGLLIQMLDGRSKLGENDLRTMIFAQQLIMRFEKNAKVGDVVLLEINNVERNLEYIETLGVNYIINTKCEEMRAMNNRVRIDTTEAQERIYNNKVEKGWNTTSIEKEICLLHGEVAEFYEAYRKKLESIGEELADIAIYLLGISEILNIDLGEEISKKIEINEKRKYEIVDGVNTRIEE